MPSPIGHVLGGIAVGSLANRRGGWTLPLVCGLVAALPDVDFLLPVPHRGPTHSLVAALAASLVTLALVSVSGWRVSPVRAAAAIGLAILSHTLLDWLGKDSSTPRGLMAFWPANNIYYISDLNVFDAVDRRYWLPGFWRRNALAVVREFAILLPIVWISMDRSPGRFFGRGARRQPSA